MTLMRANITRHHDWCQCGREKHVQLTHYEGNTPAFKKTCSVGEYKSMHQGCSNIGIDAVWCSGCGLMFHPNSI